MVSSLPEELVLEILVRLPLDEPVNLARASLVCKAWRRVLSDGDCFWRRCREFHRAPPPPPGYIQNPCYDDSSPMRFVHTTISAADSDCSGWRALDCRHGRVLVLDAEARDPSKRLIVWDPITGSQEHLSLPSASASHGSYPICSYAGAVLCAKDGCDHLDCHGGPFHVVLVEVSRASPLFATATLTRAWGAPTSNDVNHPPNQLIFSANGKYSLLVGDALYFPYGSESDLPQHLCGAILMKAEDGGLGLATLKDNCIYLWSQQDIPNVIDIWWVKRTRWVVTTRYSSIYIHLI